MCLQVLFIISCADALDAGKIATAVRSKGVHSSAQDLCATRAFNGRCHHYDDDILSGKIRESLGGERKTDVDGKSLRKWGEGGAVDISKAARTASSERESNDKGQGRNMVERKINDSPE